MNPVKVIFFGGTGNMGREAVKELSTFSEIERIALAIRSNKNIEKLLEEIDGYGGDLRKLYWLPVDLDHCQDLSKKVADYDIVVNTSGPFYKYESILALAAISAGINYISICDDYDAAKEVLALDYLAKEKGVSVLTGMGWTPGLSSLLVLLGADELNKVEKINIAWAASSGKTIGKAVAFHLLHIFSGSIPSFRKGKLEMIPAGSDKERLSFPDPIGKIYVYHTGHPEPITIPQHFNGIEEVTLKGGVNEDFFNRLARFLGKLGIDKREFLRNSVVNFFQKRFPFWKKIAGSGAEVSGIRVDMQGIIEKQPCNLTYSVVGPMEILTAINLATAVREMARGKIKKTGVFSPEAPGVFEDYRIFFKELEKKGVNIIKKIN